MANSEKVLGFRFDEDVIKKLDYMVEEEKKLTDRMGVKAKNRKEIIEDAIKNRYFKVINETQDPDVVERINELIADHVGAAVQKMILNIEEILFLCIKNDLGNRVFYRSPSVLPPPSSKQEAIEVITEEESLWDMALEEYVHHKWSQEEIHTHEIQEEYEEEEDEE